MRAVTSVDARREHEIVAALSRMAVVAVPDPEAKERTRARLMMMLAAQRVDSAVQRTDHSSVAS